MPLRAGAPGTSAPGSAGARASGANASPSRRPRSRHGSVGCSRSAVATAGQSASGSPSSHAGSSSQSLVRERFTASHPSAVASKRQLPPGATSPPRRVAGERRTLTEELRAVEGGQGRVRAQRAQRPYDTVGIRGERHRAHLGRLRVAGQRKAPALGPALRRMGLALSAYRAEHTEVLQQRVRVAACDLPPCLRCTSALPQHGLAPVRHASNSCRRESNRKWAWPVEGSTRSEMSAARAITRPVSAVRGRRCHGRRRREIRGTVTCAHSGLQLPGIIENRPAVSSKRERARCNASTPRRSAVSPGEQILALRRAHDLRIGIGAAQACQADQVRADGGRVVGKRQLFGRECRGKSARAESKQHQGGVAGRSGPAA